MNESLKKALLKQKIRRSLIPAINEQATLYSTFIQPFSDAVSAAKLGTQEVLSAARLAWDTITLSPKKMEKARSEHEARMSSIEQKWQPIMSRNIDALKRGDADVLAMVFAPGAVLTYAAGQTAYNTSVGAAKFLSDAGWKVPLLNSLPTIDIDLKNVGGGGSDSSNTAPTEEKEERSLLQKLGGLFYIESSWLKGDILLEAEQDKKVSLEKDMDSWLQATGVASEFEKSSKEYYEAHKEYLDSIASEAVPKIKSLDMMLNSSTLEQLLKSAEMARDAEIDSAIDAESLKSKVEDAAKKLIDTKKFDTSKSQDALKNSDEFSTAKKTAFVQFKTDFDEKIKQKITDLKNQAFELIKEAEPSENSAKFMKTTTQGIKFLKLFSDTTASIQNSSKLPA